MLTYHPAFDFYHCAYRILLLLTKAARDTVELDRMRIWDFYFVFPKAIKNVVMPRDLWSFKNIPDDANPYEEIVNAQRIFNRMQPFQATAFRYLAAYELIDSERLAKKEIKRGVKTIPDELLTNMHELDQQQEHVVKLISGPFSGFPLYGPSGLKARTKLLDFKYDPR